MGSKSNKIGSKFEDKVKKVCEELKRKKIALIYKVGTEWKIIRGKYGKIVNAFPMGTNFVDFVGVYKGRSISIETKTTENKTSFSLSNIQEEQYEYFKDYEIFGGLGYYIIEFRELKEVYLVESMKVEEFRINATSKSIPIAWFRENAIQLDFDKLNFIDYINV